MPGMEICRAFLFYSRQKDVLSQRSIQKNIRIGMRKTYLAYLLLCLLSACGNKEKNIVRLSGEIKGLGTDTLYLYGMDGMYDRMDRIDPASCCGMGRRNLDRKSVV